MTVLSKTSHKIVTSYTIPPLFSLAVEQYKSKTRINMKLFTDVVTTKSIHATYDILEESLPSVLKSTCFNDKNLPFSQEVRNTEIGHLFEHIILEYLCIMKLFSGYTHVVFNGVTSWNWVKNAYGTFVITIDATMDDWRIFPQALEKSIALLQVILQDKQQIPTERFALSLQE